ncbi:hypothetical protein AOLI_G00108750 [Acnodon oligacanthus]
MCHGSLPTKIPSKLGAWPHRSLGNHLHRDRIQGATGVKALDQCLCKWMGFPLLLSFLATVTFPERKQKMGTGRSCDFQLVSV